MHEIKSFKIVQTARLIAVLYAIGAAIVLVIVALISVLTGGRAGHLPTFIFFTPIIYAIVSFIGTALMCWLYNQIAARIGGIAFELLPRNEN